MNIVKTIPSSIFLYIYQNSKYKSLPKNEEMRSIYDKYKNGTGYLHIKIFTENPFW